MKMDAQKIIRLNAAPEILRSYLTDDLARIADAVGIVPAIEIACKLPFAILAFPSRCEPDPRLVTLFGQEIAMQIAGAVGGDFLRYIAVPRRTFSNKDIRDLEKLCADNCRTSASEGE